jgi:hypothetical protein
MRKVLIFLLIVGILIGAISVAAGICEEVSSGGDVDFSNDSTVEDGYGDPTPCGGGCGGGGGTPG